MIQQCPLETEITQAYKNNLIDKTFQDHIRTCPHCKQSLGIASAMMMMRDDAERRAGLMPAANLLFLKAQFSQRQESLSKLDLVTLLGLSLVGTIGIIGALLWKFPEIYRWVQNEVSPMIVQKLGLFPFTLPLMIAVLFIASIWVFSLEVFFSKKERNPYPEY